MDSTQKSFECFKEKLKEIAQLGEIDQFFNFIEKTEIEQMNPECVDTVQHYFGMCLGRNSKNQQSNHINESLLSNDTVVNRMKVVEKIICADAAFLLSPFHKTLFEVVDYFERLNCNEVLLSSLISKCFDEFYKQEKQSSKPCVKYKETAFCFINDIEKSPQWLLYPEIQKAVNTLTQSWTEEDLIWMLYIHCDMCPLFQKYFQQEVHLEKWETVFKNCPPDFINWLEEKNLERLDRLKQRLVDGVSNENNRSSAKRKM